jgi:hypothetical protein
MLFLSHEDAALENRPVTTTKTKKYAGYFSEITVVA